VLRAANLGDDADTTAAIAGQIAGARWGVSGIPTDWRERIVRAERIAAIASRLHDAAVTAPVEEPWPHDATIHGWWVEPGAVLAGEYPGATSPEGARAKIGLLVDHGVRTFVDLTQPVDGLEPYVDHVEHEAHRRGLELQHLPFPIPDMGVRPHDGYDEIVDAIRSSRDRGVVYVHCWGGIGRTSTVVGCLLVDAGLDADAALADIDRRRSGTRKAHQPAPQTPSQIDVVRARSERRHRDWLRPSPGIPATPIPYVDPCRLPMSVDERTHHGSNPRRFRLHRDPHEASGARRATSRRLPRRNAGRGLACSAPAGRRDVRTSRWSGMTRLYSSVVKTAVSIPDPIFEAADRLARRRRISRSELYAEALAQLLEADESHGITERLDDLYGDRPSELDPGLAALQARAIDEDW
jgi:hypothetical protein